MIINIIIIVVMMIWKIKRERLTLIVSIEHPMIAFHKLKSDHGDYISLTMVTIAMTIMTVKMTMVND